MCGHENIIVAKTMFETNSQLIPICVVNLSIDKVVLKSRQVIGTAAPIYSLASLSNDENPLVDKNYRKIVDEMSKGANLNEVDKQKLQELLLKHRKAFALENEPLGVTNLVKHEIDTGNAEPIAKPAFRTPIAHRKILQEEIRKMLDEGVIQPSKSPWAAPLFLVKKKGGSWRPVIDFRGLNAVTKNDVYPLPLIDDYVDALGESKYFSTIDLKYGFWQISMHQNSVEKTGFICQEGHFEFRKMPFGLKNAPSDFQRLIDVVLKGMTWKFCLVYIDDVIIFSKTIEKHIENLSSVLTAIGEAGLKLKPKNVHFSKKRSNFWATKYRHTVSNPIEKKLPIWSTTKCPPAKRRCRNFSVFFSGSGDSYQISLNWPHHCTNC